MEQSRGEFIQVAAPVNPGVRAFAFLKIEVDIVRLEDRHEVHGGVMYERVLGAHATATTGSDWATAAARVINRMGMYCLIFTGKDIPRSA